MKAALSICALLLLTAWAYRGVDSAGWVYEDSNFVTENPAVTGHEPIQIGRARWLANLVNRVQWVHAPNARAFHLGNLTLHLVNGLLVYALALTLTNSAAVAWLTAAIFLLHPIQTEAVAYVAGRTELLAACCALSAWTLHMCAPPRRWWVHGLVWVFVLLAVSAKETAVVIVPLMVLSDIVQGQRLSKLNLALLVVPIVGIAASVLVMDHTAVSPLGHWAYAATQATALWRYLGLIVVPYGFTVDHDFEIVPWVVRWGALWALCGLASVLLLLTASVGDEDRSQGRLWQTWQSPAMGTVVFGGLWALIALAPRFVMRTPEALSEHQLYLPAVGLSLMMGSALCSTLSRAAVHPASSANAGRLPTGVLRTESRVEATT